MRTASSFRALLALASLIAAPALAAAAPAAAPALAPAPAPAITLTEGVEYARLSAPEPAAAAKKIEVLEVFSYGCVHCFHLEEALQAWKARLPPDVELHYLPATFRPEFTLYARVFDAIWNAHAPVHSLADLANVYASLGVDRARFIEAAQSAGNRAAIDAAHEQLQRLQVDGTPSFIVAGRYRVLGELIDGSAELLQRVDAVIAMARAERRGGH